MAGELVPVVMLPRFTCLSGAGTFKTIAMDVTAYSSAILSIWRSALVGGSPTFIFGFEESSDQNTWTNCTVSPAISDPGTNTEVQYTVTLKKRWFRVFVTLTDAGVVSTCWMTGFLEERIA